MEWSLPERIFHMLPTAAILLYIFIVTFTEDKQVLKSINLLLVGSLVIVFFSNITSLIYPEITFTILMCNIAGVLGGFCMLTAGVVAAPIPKQMAK